MRAKTLQFLDDRPPAGRVQTAPPGVEYMYPRRSALSSLFGASTYTAQHDPDALAGEIDALQKRLDDWRGRPVMRSDGYPDVERSNMIWSLASEISKKTKEWHRLTERLKAAQGGG